MRMDFVVRIEGGDFFFRVESGTADLQLIHFGHQETTFLVQDKNNLQIYLFGRSRDVPDHAIHRSLPQFPGDLLL